MLAPILAIAGVAAVQAGPLYKRQDTTVISSPVSTIVESATDAASSVATAASSAVDSASSAVSSAVMSASSGVESASSMASSMASSATSSAAAITSSDATTGNQSYPLFPCPTGYLLTYVELNQTIPVPVTQVVNTFGEWANSSYFPNVTMSEGGNTVGATHTLNLQGTELMEMLVNATMFNTSGAARWEWNLTNGPVSAMGVSLSNYTTVLSIYDPTYDQTGTIGNETTLLTFTNFCADSQAEGMTLVSALAGLELGTFVSMIESSAGSGAAPAGPEASSTMMSSDMMMSSSMMASSSMMDSSMAMSTSTIATDGSADSTALASSVASGASGAASTAVAVPTSVLSEITSIISGAVPTTTA